jgi:hypothetical protein
MNATTRIKPIHRLINRLKLKGLRSQKTASGFQAQCPAHEDQHESLSIKEGTDARVLLKCHAGCEVKAIVAALDLSLADLFENSVQTRGNVDSIYRYEDREGHDLFRVVRYRPKDFRVGRASASGDFEWGLGGVTPVLYHLPDILEAGKAGERIFIVEGEKDVESLVAVGLKATTNFGGAGKWRQSYSESLRGARVAIVPDNDVTGRAHAQNVAAALAGVASEVKVIELVGLAVKGDVSNWCEAGHTADELNALVESTPVWTASSSETEPSPPEALEGEREEGSQKPEVIASGRQLPAITQDAFEALKAANAPPELFARHGSMVSAVLDEAGRRVIQMVTENGLRGRLARSGDYFRVIKGGKRLAIPPPLEVVKDILSLAPSKWSLPILEGVIETPVIREDGTLVQEKGYDAATRLYYEPAPGLEFPKVPDIPSEAAVRDAIALIDEVIGEFPFEDEASKANAMALLLTPIVRHIVPGCIPLALIDAPQAGNGKSLFTEVISITATGRNAPMRVAAYQNEEWRKTLTTEFMYGSTFIVFDNLQSVLQSPALAAAITSSIWSDRVLGKNERVEVPQRAVIIVTGNNIQLAGDFNRRCFWIRLNAKVSCPWQGREFKHPELLKWLATNRGHLIAALLTLVRHWYASDRPIATTPVLGSFEEWCRIIGGVLGSAGIRGFLGNLSALLERADQDRGEWQVFLEWIWEKRRDDVFRVADLIGNIKGLCETLPEGSPQGTEYLPSSLSDKWDPSRIHPFLTALGRAMKRNVETRYGPRGIHLRSEKPLPGTGGVACYSIGFVDPPTTPTPFSGPASPPPDDLEWEPPAPTTRVRGRRKPETRPTPSPATSNSPGDAQLEPATPEGFGSGDSKTSEPS